MAALFPPSCAFNASRQKWRASTGASNRTSCQPLPAFNEPCPTGFSFFRSRFCPSLRLVRGASARSISRIGWLSPLIVAFSGPFRSRTIISFSPFFNQQPGMNKVCCGPISQKRPIALPFTQTIPLPQVCISRNTSPGVSRLKVAR